ARPRADETVAVKQACRIHGAAWAGEADVTRVEVSVGGGKNWAQAKLLGNAAPFCWRLWEVFWAPSPARPGRLLARALPFPRRRTQPLERDPNRRNYMISHCLPVELDVK